jgi:hypothetical protein
MDTTGRTVFSGQRLPLDTGSQHIEDSFHYLARRYRFSPGAGFSPVGLVFVPFPLRDEILDSFPQVIRQFP